jgi:hypothetical protein
MKEYIVPELVTVEIRPEESISACEYTGSCDVMGWYGQNGS